MILELLAPAKLNLVLEITGRRYNGYHDIVSVMQTIDLCDRVRISDAEVLELSIEGGETRGVPSEGPRNLAFAAALALASAAGNERLGGRIELDKQIPAGMGLGGGSSDAAAVLRGLNELWRLDFDDGQLCNVGASIGSDVPFFVLGGTAFVTGRGEQVEPLPDAATMHLTLFVCSTDIEDKTRSMYGLIGASDYSSGDRARVLAENVRRGLPPSTSELFNAFDPHLPQVDGNVGRAMTLCRDAGLAVFACGSGPAFFSPTPFDALPPMLEQELISQWGVRAIACRTLSRAEALAVREV